MTDIRDTQGAYRAALVEEYESYKRAGRRSEAAHVARVLREQYGHDVEPAPEPEAPVERPEPEVKETAAAAPPPEAAVEPKPAVKKAAPARRPTAKKTGEG